MGVVECGEPGDFLSADRIVVPPCRPGVLCHEVDSSGSLWIPRIGRKVGLGLGLGFLQRPSAGAEVAAPHRAEASLVGEGGQRDRPAFTQLANDVLDGNHRIAQEDLVERGVAVHLAKWSDLDAVLAHGQGHPRDPLVLGGVPVGPCQQHSERGVMGARAPDLLSVHDEDLAVPDRRRGQPGEI